jgi:hypothetical protein
MGNTHSNVLGVYFCIAYQYKDFKADACQKMDVPDSPFRKGETRRQTAWTSSQIQSMDFKWDPSGRDGDCLCKPRGSDNSEYKLCNSVNQEEIARSPQATPCPQGFAPATADTQMAVGPGLMDDGKVCNADESMLAAIRSGDINAVMNARPPILCICPKNNLSYPASRVSADCSAAQVSPDPTKAVTATTPAASVDNTRPSDDLKNCVDSHVEFAQSCKDTANEAKHKCDSDDAGNKDSADAVAALSAVSRSTNAQLANSGARQTCILAGSAANTAKGIIENMQGGCESDFGTCQNACSTAQNYHKFETECQAKMNTSQPNYQANLNYYNEHQPAIQQNFASGSSDCSGDTTKKKDDMSVLLNGLGEAMRSSAVCACQLSTANGNCNNIPTTAQCDSNPSLAGCNAYGDLTSNVCLLGANYNAALCECQKNPTGAACKAAATAGASAMASGAIKTATNNVAAGFIPSAAATSAAGGLGNDFSLGSQASDAQVSSGSSASSGGAGLKNVSSGGDSGSIAGPGGSEVEAQAASSDKTGLSAVFGFVKNSFGGLFGKTKNNGDLDAEKKRKAAFDASRFRPTRGTASIDVGSKNMDIWKMMNNCVQGATCQSNQNSFMLQP